MQISSNVSRYNWRIIEKLNREFGCLKRLFEYKWVSAKVLMLLTNGIFFAKSFTRALKQSAYVKFDEVLI